MPISLLAPSLVFMALVLASGGAAYAAYRRDMARIRARLAAGSSVAETAFGPIEYSEAGNGPAVLVIHGASGGYDQGLLIARENFRPGLRVISPSRFGYLRTPLPDDASPAAQADAHAALLDALGIDRIIVLGFSAGVRSAIQLALRHQKRVSALILESPVMVAPFRLPNFNSARMGRMLIQIVSPGVDFLYWSVIQIAPGLLVRFLGAPWKLYAAASPRERDFILEVLRTMLPLSARLKGLANDAVNVTETWPFNEIKAPTLIIAATDDPFEPLAAAQTLAAAIEGAKLLVIPSGSHLLVGHHEQVRSEVADLAGTAE